LSGCLVSLPFRLLHLLKILVCFSSRISQFALLSQLGQLLLLLPRADSIFERLNFCSKLGDQPVVVAV
jgi:hypothetical protein